MYDVSSKRTYKSIRFWKLKVKELCGDIPILIVGNKIDSPYRKIVDDNTINISVKTNQNIQSLFELIDEKF